MTFRSIMTCLPLIVIAQTLLPAVHAFIASSSSAVLSLHKRRFVVPDSITMRYGKKDVTYRSLVNSRINKASTTAALAEVQEYVVLSPIGKRMKRNLFSKIYRKASSLGQPLPPSANSDTVTPEKNGDPPPPPFTEKEKEKKTSDATLEAAADENIMSQVDQKVKAAMKAREKVLVVTLRNIKAALAAAAKDAGVETLDDNASIKVLRKLSKMRQESIDMYDKAGEAGAERAEAERAELRVIEQWLPQLADEALVRKWIQDIIDNNNDAKLMKGKIMGQLMKAHKDELDGKMAGKVVDEYMEELSKVSS